MLVSLLFLAVGIPIFLYLVLWLSPVHEKIRTIATTELTSLLGADVAIGTLRVQPFTRLELGDICITAGGDTLLTAGKLNAGISGRNLLRGRIVVTDVELMEPSVRLRRDSATAPLNVQPVLDRLKGDGSKPPTAFDLAVHTVVIRGGSGSYDIADTPARPSGFDPAHIAVSDINADLTAPKISNGRIMVSLKRFTAREHSGPAIRHLAVDVDLADNVLNLRGLTLRLNSTSLAFADMALDLKGRKIGAIELLRGSAVYPGDFSPFNETLAHLPGPIMIDARVELLRDSVSVSRLNISVPSNNIFVSARAAEASRMQAGAPNLSFGIGGVELAHTIGLFSPLKSNVQTMLAALGYISFSGAASWHHPRDITLQGLLLTNAGTIGIDGAMASKRLHGSVEASDVDLGKLFPGKELGKTGLSATFDLSRTDGHASVAVSHLGWRNHDFRNIDAELDFSGHAYDAVLAINDSLAVADIHLAANTSPGNYFASIAAEIPMFSPSAIGMLTKYPGHRLSATVNGEFSGPEPLRPTGSLTVSDLSFTDPDGKGLIEAPIRLTSDFESATQSISLDSDLLDLSVRGTINPATLAASVRDMLASALPQYFEPHEVDSSSINNFTINATIHDDAPLLSFMDTPMQLLYPATLTGHVNSLAGEAAAIVSAPYVRKGNSLISGTMLSATLGANQAVTAHTRMPSKFGNMDLNLNAALSGGKATASVAFDNSAPNRYAGRIDLTVKPLQQGADINILPGTLTLGNVAWTIEPAFAAVRNGSAIINGFGIVRPGQELTISGMVSEHPEDRLVVGLDNINLDYIFQTLQLAETVQFGGDATGTVTASALLGDEPFLQTDNLFAKNFSYGHCVMGDAAIRSRWNNATRGIEIHADVTNNDTRGTTVVDGEIYPLSSELDFRFQANHTPVGFLRTFMATWASGVGGTASGNCHLYGDFKNVDLTGDFLAENFALTIGFTGVTYYATDSIHIRPGIIDLDRITLRDHTGRTGIIDGSLTHRKFQDARFKFKVSDLDRMLVLDTRPTDDNDRWYGTVRANGSVDIKGVPGHVSISAAASTAPGSEFTFALTDAASAAEYTFLTFRDATPPDGKDTIPAAPGSPELDRIMQAKVAKASQLASSSAFDFDLQVDVTPDARMNLIMDPNAGDKITGSGSGHIGVVYGSANDEMRLYGDYRIEKGEYNFSLQDIILKSFTIRDGSEVSFHGDPMDAQLDISAIYQVNANLSDLDESFLNDKEVQRTNVPVYAVLNVDGSLQDPQIAFDLDFPTLTSDVKRKVKSIVSTDDMMNRQIIYLLALNRFYTPEYMTATKGNDLVSVASGTLSSQLSNILGQLSDKISVAPSVRTESGDFSDVEFDVALSSTLLNNRLLLNGNFGYRDKSLNNNQFIGDFDVEYLLTRRGNWRLKAYNHFNDRNLYVKTALTTQGIGLVFKHDFDSLFKRRRK